MPVEHGVNAVAGPVSRRFEGKVALVAGGGRTPPEAGNGIGVGAATSMLLAREGCRVAVLDRDVDAANRTVKSIAETGGEAIAIQADVSVDADCARAIAEVQDAYGTLHALLNTLGITRSRRSVTQFVDEEWTAIMEVNVRGFMLTAKHAIPLMTEGGAIVNVSSADAVVPSHGNATFAASKGAVNSLTRHIAVREGYRGIRANAIMPGAMWTPIALTKLGTAVGADKKELPEAEREAVRRQRRQITATQTEGTAWDIAHAAAFLASDQSRWITGQVLMVDGGASVIAPWDVQNKPARTVADSTLHFVD
ncbi:SDR family NAD(P)-dependent oxidoreductase [Amycolatopsis echigonensis]